MTFRLTLLDEREIFDIRSWILDIWPAVGFALLCFALNWEGKGRKRRAGSEAQETGLEVCDIARCAAQGARLKAQDELDRFWENIGLEGRGTGGRSCA